MHLDGGDFDGMLVETYFIKVCEGYAPFHLLKGLTLYPLQSLVSLLDVLKEAYVVWVEPYSLNEINLGLLDLSEVIRGRAASTNTLHVLWVD